MIRTAGRAFIIQENQILAVKYKEKDQIYYALPGGGQEQGESLHGNLQRECLEELGVNVDIGELIFVREWIHEDIHQIEFIFKCIPNQTIKEIKSEVPDPNQIGIEWLPIAQIMDYHLYPLQMREHVLREFEGYSAKVPVYLGYGN